MSEKNAVRLIGSTLIWLGVAGLSALFHHFGQLTGSGAAWLVFAGLMLTAGLWNTVE